MQYQEGDIVRVIHTGAVVPNSRDLPRKMGLTHYFEGSMSEEYEVTKKSFDHFGRIEGVIFKVVAVRPIDSSSFVAKGSLQTVAIAECSPGGQVRDGARRWLINSRGLELVSRAVETLEPKVGDFVQVVDSGEGYGSYISLAEKLGLKHFEEGPFEDDYEVIPKRPPSVFGSIPGVTFEVVGEYEKEGILIIRDPEYPREWLISKRGVSKVHFDPNATVKMVMPLNEVMGRSEPEEIIRVRVRNAAKPPTFMITRHTIKEEPTMSTKIVETKTYVNDQLASELSAEDLIRVIQDTEGKIAELNCINVVSTRIEKTIAELEEQLDKLVELLDAK